MCGITGFFCPRYFHEFKSELSGAASLIAHRGPDDEGFFYDARHGLGLAHRRLSIIDLSDAAHQPMHSDDGRFVIVYNGEIYNYLTIRMAISIWSIKDIFKLMGRAVRRGTFETTFDLHPDQSVLSRLMCVDQPTYLHDAM